LIVILDINSRDHGSSFFKIAPVAASRATFSFPACTLSQAANGEIGRFDFSRKAVPAADESVSRQALLSSQTLKDVLLAKRDDRGDSEIHRHNKVIRRPQVARNGPPAFSSRETAREELCYDLIATRHASSKELSIPEQLIESELFAN